MEQLGSSASTTDTTEAVSEATTTKLLTNNQSKPRVPLRGSATSSSVPTLRFPRPVGDRRLTNWVSSSQPDIMHTPTFPDGLPLDSSITDGYEVIGTDGESHADGRGLSYEHANSELDDDVQSLADTDTGTDAYTNDVDTDSSGDEGEELEDELEHTTEPTNKSAMLIDEEDEDVDMSEAERSLEHPTELFTPDSAHLSRRASFSDQDRGDLPLSRDSSSLNTIDSKDDKPWITLSIRDVLAKAADHFGNDALRQRLIGSLVVAVLVIATTSIGRYMQTDLSGQTGVLTTVPVASVSSVVTPLATEIFVSTSTVTSTVTSTETRSLALRTTSSSKSASSISPNSALHMQQNLCSASVYGRNEILLKVPKQFKSSWLAKQAVMISVSRSARDISSKATKITTVDEGFVLEVPHDEAYGILDVTIATTRKPQIIEIFKVNFGNFIIVDALDALDAGKQLVKGFAQSVADTLNGTTAWVEETCSPAFELISKPASATNPVMQGLREATQAALELRAQIADFVKQPFPEGRMKQTRRELWRTAQDVRDEASLFVLQAQLNSRLQWLRWSGQNAEYERYRAAAGPHYHKKQEEAAMASRARAERTREEIRAGRR